MPQVEAYPVAPTRAGHWWRELNAYHWRVLIVATLGWLFDSMDQRLFVLARTPALRELLPGASEAEITSRAGYATCVFILGWATGGLVFGLFGDRWGRTRTMTLTILIYSVFTGLSALAQGWWDFALYRFLCGTGIGGEYAAGLSLVAETMPARARPYCLGFLQGLAALGHVGGSILSLAVGPQAEIEGVAGWRLLFLVGVLPALLVVIIRSSLREPDSWVRVQAGDKLHRKTGDLRELFGDGRWRRHLLVGMALGVAGQVGIWGIGFWSPELIRGAQLEQRQAEFGDPSHANLAELARAASRTDDEAKMLLAQWRAEDDTTVGIATVLQDLAGMLGIYAFTLLTVRIGRRPAFAITYLLALATTIVTFAGLRTRSDSYWMAPLLGFGVSAVFGGFAIYFPELFPTRLRSTGTGFCYNVARYFTAFGPLTLGRLTLLFAGLDYALPLRPAAIALSGVYLLGLAALPFAPETRNRPLPE
jgi:MFS family permease